MIQRCPTVKNGGPYTATFSELQLTLTSKTVGGRRVRKLLKDFHVVVKHQVGHEHFVIKAGFETDFASVPYPLTFMLGSVDAVGVGEAAIVHDALCVAGVPAFYANAKMRTILELYGVPRWKCIAYFVGLMCFGYGSAVFNWATMGKFRRDAQVRSDDGEVC